MTKYGVLTRTISMFPVLCLGIVSAMATPTPVASTLAGAPRGANETAMPDPANLLLPDLRSLHRPKVIKNGWKHFYFYKPDVTYTRAYTDFAECYTFLPVVGPLGAGGLPMFVPWKETAGFAPTGFVVGGLVAGPILRRSFQSRMRRCMEPRGYARYPLDEAAWDRLIDNYSRQSIALQAKAASGAAPDAEAVTDR